MFIAPVLSDVLGVVQRLGVDAPIAASVRLPRKQRQLQRLQCLPVCRPRRLRRRAVRYSKIRTRPVPVILHLHPYTLTRPGGLRRIVGSGYRLRTRTRTRLPAGTRSVYECDVWLGLHVMSLNGCLFVRGRYHKPS